MLNVNGRRAGDTEVVHIYAGMDSILAWTFSNADFVTTMNVPVSVQINPASGVNMGTVTLKHGSDTYNRIGFGFVHHHVCSSL